MIAEAFEILENVHRMAARIKSFKDLSALDIQHDENLFLNHVATFFGKVQSIIKETRKKKSLPPFPRIKEIQAS